MNVYLTSKACYIVQTETNHIAAYLTWNGHKLVGNIHEADAIIITTCAVTGSAAQTTYEGIFESINKRQKNAPVYVVGCYPRIEKERMHELSSHENIFSVPEYKDLETIFPGSNSWESISYSDFFAYPFGDERLEVKKKEASLIKKVVLPIFSGIDSLLKTDILFYFHFRRHLYNPEIQRRIWPVIISKGCIHACTYCAVRKGRGKHTSKPLSLVKEEIKTGINKGYKKFLLIGDEVGTYGVDLKDGTSLSSLLEALNSDDFPISIGFWYLDCFNFMEAVPQIEELCEKGKIFFLGITLQSGSYRILGLMNRHYSLEDTMDAIQKFRKNTNIVIATQIMVGFPTETEEDFKRSFDLIDKGYFDLVEVYEYSPRPGTRAAKMEDDVPSDVKAKRATILRKIAAKKSRKLFMKKILHELRHSGKLQPEKA